MTAAAHGAHQPADDGVRAPVVRVGRERGAVAPLALPMALAGVQRRLTVGDELVLVLPRPGTARPARPSRGVGSAAWGVDVLVGAGFEVVSGSSAPADRIVARRALGLADRVGPGMRLLLCGLNPSIYAAERGVAFARPGNRFWPALLAAGLAERDRDPDHALRAHAVGFTDLVKRATRTAAELQPEEFAEGLQRIERLARWLRPAAICVLGVSGFRLATGDRRVAAGPLGGGLAGIPAYLAPNPSGLNAHVQLPAMVEHLRAAARLGAR